MSTTGKLWICESEAGAGPRFLSWFINYNNFFNCCNNNLKIISKLFECLLVNKIITVVIIMALWSDNSSSRKWYRPQGLLFFFAPPQKQQSIWYNKNLQAAWNFKLSKPWSTTKIVKSASTWSRSRVFICISGRRRRRRCCTRWRTSRRLGTDTGSCCSTRIYYCCWRFARTGCCCSCDTRASQVISSRGLLRRGGFVALLHASQIITTRCQRRWGRDASRSLWRFTV